MLDGDVLELGRWLVKQHKDYASNRMPTEQRMTFEQLIGNDGNTMSASSGSSSSSSSSSSSRVVDDNTATNAAATTTEPCSATIADDNPTSSVSLEHLTVGIGIFF